MGIHNKNLLMKLKNCPKFVSELWQQRFCLGTDITALRCTRYTWSIRVCCHQQDWCHSTCYPTVTWKITNIYILVYQQMREFHWARVILTASSELVSQYCCLAITLKSPNTRHQTGSTGSTCCREMLLLHLPHSFTPNSLRIVCQKYTQFSMLPMSCNAKVICKCFVYNLQPNFPLTYCNTLRHDAWRP
jgi:hypothetical protein